MRLERPNGDISKIPLTKLSKEDQDFLRKEAKRRVQQESPPSPTSASPRPARIRKKSSSAVPSYDDWAPPSMNAIVEADLPQSNAVIRSTSSKGRFQADPAINLSSDWETLAVKISPKQGFFESLVAVDISDSDNPQIFAAHTGGKGISEPRSRLERIDIASGRTTHYPSAPGKIEKISVSPSGKRLLTMSDQGHGWPPTQFDVWEVTENELVHLVSWLPYDHLERNKTVETFRWLDDEHLFTSNSKKNLICWDVANARALYEKKLDWTSDPEFSPGRKQFAVATNEGVDIYETISGDLLQHLDTEGSWIGKIAFSPSGERMAVVNGRFIEIVDIANNKRAQKIFNKNAGWGAKWLDEKYLLLKGGDVIDIETTACVWKFTNLGEEFAGNPLKRWVFNKQKRQVLCFSLPREAMQEASENLAKLSDEELLAFTPGSKISLDIQLINRNLTPEAESYITEAIEQAGMQVAPDQPIVLSARMENGKRNTTTYREFGFRGKESEVSFTPIHYKLSLAVNGQVVWESTSTQSPGMHISLKEGQTINSAISELMQPNAAHFKTKLPSRILKPIYQEPQGNTAISAGI